MGNISELQASSRQIAAVLSQKLLIKPLASLVASYLPEKEILLVSKNGMLLCLNPYDRNWSRVEMKFNRVKEQGNLVRIVVSAKDRRLGMVWREGVVSQTRRFDLEQDRFPSREFYQFSRIPFHTLQISIPDSRSNTVEYIDGKQQKEGTDNEVFDSAYGSFRIPANPNPSGEREAILFYLEDYPYKPPVSLPKLHLKMQNPIPIVLNDILYVFGSRSSHYALINLLPIHPDAAVRRKQAKWEWEIYPVENELLADENLSWVSGEATGKGVNIWLAVSKPKTENQKSDNVVWKYRICRLSVRGNEWTDFGLSPDLGSSARGLLVYKARTWP